MEIKTFKDGYSLTHRGKDYLWAGKSNIVIKGISDKVAELLTSDLEDLKAQLLKDNYIN